MCNEKTIVVPCPHCGQKAEYTMIEIVDADKHCFEKQMLLNGTFFEFKCCNCGKNTDLFYDVVYRDKSHNAVIYFVADEKINGVCSALSLSAGLELLDGRKVESFPAIRVIDDYDVFREKIGIFDNGLDDRAIELIKAMCLEDAQKQMPECGIKEAFFYMSNNKMTIELYGDGDPAMSDVPDGFYEQIKNQFADVLAVDTSFSVDNAWARGVLYGESDDPAFTVEMQDDE
jgi:hypothetical protein